MDLCLEEARTGKWCGARPVSNARFQPRTGQVGVACYSGARSLQGLLLALQSVMFLPRSVQYRLETRS
jgi:hypothetical protein